MCVCVCVCVCVCKYFYNRVFPYHTVAVRLPFMWMRHEYG